MLDGNWPFWPSPSDGSSRPESAPSPFALPSGARLDPEFRLWADAYRRSTPAGDALAEALLSTLIAAAWRLRRVHRREPLHGPARKNWQRALAQAERSWSRAVADWTQYLQARGLIVPDVSNALAGPRAKAEAEAPTRAETPAAPIVLPDDVSWSDHIGLDPNVSHLWPVILGTEILAEQVAALFLEGWDADRILRHYPELTPVQLAACLACESARFCGPWENGRPTPRPPEAG